MEKQLLLILSVFCITCASSQFTDTTNYLVNYSSTGIINKTDNGNSYVFSNAFKFAARKKSITLNSSSSWIYGQQGNKHTNNDFSYSLDFNLYKTIPRFYYWGLATYDKSYSLRINNRIQAGLGIAYSFIDKETAFFNISDGILYEASNLKNNDSTKNTYQTLRNSLRIRYRVLLSHIILLDGTHFWQPSFYEINDYVLKSNIALSVKLKKWLNITTAATYNRLNRTQRENLLITFGLTAEKYF
jgi:hypothetical protein